MCLCDLDLRACVMNLELRITLKAGSIPGIFLLFLLHPPGWYGELSGSSVLGLKRQDRLCC